MIFVNATKNRTAPPMMKRVVRGCCVASSGSNPCLVRVSRYGLAGSFECGIFVDGCGLVFCQELVERRLLNRICDDVGRLLPIRAKPRPSNDEQTSIDQRYRSKTKGLVLTATQISNEIGIGVIEFSELTIRAHLQKHAERQDNAAAED